MWRASAIAIVSALAAAEPASARTAFKTFQATTHFTATYPANWSRIDIGRDRLDVLSPGHREEGIVIGEGQAEVELWETTVTEIANRDVALRSDGDVSNIRRAIYPGSNAPGACERLLAVSSDYNDAPREAAPRLEHDVELNCRVGRRRFTIRLRHWSDDPKAAHHLAAALGIARSLRAE
jgi:hypothetical protein